MNTITRIFILTLSVGLASLAGARGLVQTPSSDGVIRVIVRTSGTLEPIAGARATLTPGQVSSLTGANGVAVFDKLAYGFYSIRVDREGYVVTPPANSFAISTPTTLSATAVAGPQPVDVSVLLSPGGSINGRVLDAYGVPIANARVLAGSIGYREGRRVYIQQNSAQPDGVGNYVLTPLGAGEYYLRLESSAQRGGGDYYPGVADIDNAIRIPVQAGQQIVGIDFNMSNSRTFKVSGTVLNLPARTLANGQPDNSVPSLTFASADPHNVDSQTTPLVANGRRGSNGEFEIALPPGLWDVFPVINMRVSTPAARGNNVPAPFSAPTPGLPVYATGRARVLVVDRDVENLSVTIAASDIKGHIVFDGGTPLLVTMRVSLLPLDNTPSPLISHIRAAQTPDAAGSFSFESVPAGRYSLQITTIPVGFYVADIRVESKSIYDDGAIVVGTEPIGPVEVTLRSGGGQVRVTTGTSATTAGPNTMFFPYQSVARFVLVPAAPRQQNVLLYKSFAPARLTTWTFPDIAPGDYTVFAFEALPTGGAEQNAEFMAKYEGRGVAVHVNAGQAVSVQVPWIPAGQ
jgi:hypothetical protein